MREEIFKHWRYRNSKIALALFVYWHLPEDLCYVGRGADCRENGMEGRGCLK